MAVKPIQLIGLKPELEPESIMKKFTKSDLRLTDTQSIGVTDLLHG